LRDITNHFRGYRSANVVELPLAIVLATGIHVLE